MPSYCPALNISVQTESRPRPVCLHRSSLQSHKINIREIHSFSSQKTNPVAWQVFATCLCFHLLFRRSLWWPDPVELLISCRLEGTVVDSKSFLWDETEYLPAGVFALRPCLGLWGLLWHVLNSGYLRNVAQTWQRLSRQHPDML